MKYNYFLKYANRTPKQEEPEKIGAWDYITNYADDDLSYGVGHMLSGIADMTERATRPDNMTPQEWRKHQSGLLKNFTTGTRALGEKFQEGNDVPELEDGSVPYHLRNIIRSLPESVATMAVATALGGPIGGAVGGLGRLAGGAVLNSAKARNILFGLQKAYQAPTTAGKIDRTIIPTDARTIASAGIGAGLEANSERQQAINELVDEAKRNGTYVQGQTELEAERKTPGVFSKNFGVISLFNLPQYGMFFGKPAARSLAGKAGRLALAGNLEGLEEVGQELVRATELDKPIEYRDLRDAYVAGAGMGVGMHGAGRAANYLANRGLPSEEEIENARREIGRKKSADASSLYGSFRQETQNILSQNKGDAELRSWADKISGGQMSDGVFNSIVRNAQEFGIDPKLALAQATAESEGRQGVTSPAGAVGVMQLMPETARELGVDPYDTEDNIRGGMKYLRQMYDKFGDWNLALAAYNAGPGAVTDHIPQNGETENYVARINGFLDNAPEYKSGKDIFGAENYNMPTQGERIAQQVSQLKDGWSQVIPQIGGVLRDKFKINAAISSAARSAEHNAEVGGVPTSYHIIREGGGDALDIVFDRETSQAEQDQIAEYFRNTGLFSEVLYHDVGSGAHLHLGGLKTENLKRNEQQGIPSLPQWNDYVRTTNAPKQKKSSDKPFGTGTEDKITQEILKDAIQNEQPNNAIVNNGVEANNVFNGAFGNPLPVAKSTEAILNSIVNAPTQKQTQQESKTKSDSAQEKTVDRNISVIRAAQAHLNDLLKSNVEGDKVTAWKLNSAIQSGDVATMGNILKQDNVSIPEPQPAKESPKNQQPEKLEQEPLKENRLPENILPQATPEQPQQQATTTPLGAQTQLSLDTQQAPNSLSTIPQADENVQQPQEQPQEPAKQEQAQEQGITPAQAQTQGNEQPLQQPAIQETTPETVSEQPQTQTQESVQEQSQPQTQVQEPAHQDSEQGQEETQEAPNQQTQPTETAPVKETKSETPANETTPRETQEQRMNRRAKELLAKVADEGKLYVPDYDTKEIKAQLGKDENGRATVRMVGKFPDRKAYDKFNFELKFWGHHLGRWVDSPKYGKNARHEGVKLDKKGVFHFDDSEDATVFQKALQDYLSFDDDIKQELSEYRRTPEDVADKPQPQEETNPNLSTEMANRIEEDPASVFYDDSLINKEKLDSDLEDESSPVSKILDSHDVVTDKDGEAVALRQKDKSDEGTEEKPAETASPVKEINPESRKSSTVDESGLTKEETSNEQGEPREGTRSDDGHRNGEPAVREATGEATREDRRAESSGKDSGRKRQDEEKPGRDAAETNAENERPVREDGAGETSSRTGAGIGVRGDSGTVQSDEQRGQPVRDDGGGLSNTRESTEAVKPEKPEEETEKPKEEATKRETAGHNFHITKEHGIGEGGLKTKFKQNIDAIKLLKQLESEGRRATPSEQAILAKFNGWGTIASVFSDNAKWQKEQAQLKELLTKEEYESAHSVQMDAFYTSPEIAQAIWQGVTRLGFKGGKVLDPSTGSGIFFGTMPIETAGRSLLAGTELDSLTGRIAKQLYQNADIEITGFQNRALPDNYFDLAISNVPFSNDVKILSDPAYRKNNFALHNYFFAKSIDKVRPGGLVAFITSTGTLNSPASLDSVYQYLNKKADLVAAFKLPSNTFDKNAGTQVTTDVVIFQKRLDPRKPASYAQEWGTTQYKRYDTGDDSYGHWFDLNRYFVEHPEHMLGKPAVNTLYPNSSSLALDGRGRDVAKELGELMGKLPEDIFKPIVRATPTTNKTILSAPSGQPDGSFTLQDGKVFQKQGLELVEVTGKGAEATREYIHLLGTLDALLKAQLDTQATDERISNLRSLLNQKYDSFVKKYGYLNSPTNSKRFISDPNYGRVAAIENYREDKKAKKVSASKADIFSKRTVEAIKEPSSADTPVDGLSLSLAMRGRVDMDYISSLTGKSEAEVVKALGDLIYRNPETNLYELSEEYLSGNVREKLAYAKEAARTNPAFKRNVKALEKVQPADLTEQDISPHLGAVWIKPEYYEAFIRHMFGDTTYDIGVTYSPVTGEWTVDGEAYGKEYYRWRVEGTKWDFLSMMEAAMNKKTPTVTKERKIDEEKTAEAREKVEHIKEEFEKWIWTDDARKRDLLETYNVEFNSTVLRNYENGDSLTFPGLAEDVRQKLYPHQRNAIWRILQGKNTLLAHCVGAGKTWEMQIAAMEMKRLGIIKKPLFVVPPNILKQFEREFRLAYPSAKLLTLTASDLKAPKTSVSYSEKLDTTGRGKPEQSAVKTNDKETEADKQARRFARRQALSKIATGDWDGIILSHDMFLRLPMSPETYNDFYREQKELLQEEKQGQYGSKANDKRHQKMLASAIASLEQKLARDINEEKKEIVIPFEELGIDQIFVDEADMFKNLGFNTHYNSARGEYVTGITTTNAQRSTDMYIKTKWLTKMRNGGGVVFATGTPISNSLNEIYTMQRYLDYPLLQGKSIYHFDNWAGMFAKEVKSMEASPSGEGFREVTRLKLTNLQTLIGMFRKVADVKMAEDLPHLTRPKLKNNSHTVVQIAPTNAFKEFKKELLLRANAIHGGHVDPKEDNYLKIVSDFRKASLDMRLIDPTISESEAGGKIDAICSAVAAKYKETAGVKGAQLIFSDLSVPRGKDTDKTDTASDEQTALDEETTLDDISVYERIKKGLIARGVPAEQIAFVHEAKNANQRQILFDRVNNGDIRVIIGSTSKMGAGTNFQKHLVALHHLDCPWRPRDIEQREGRILRSGNENEEVEIFTYVTKGSYDANMWEKVSIKQSMIDSVMRGDPNIKELDDVSEISASYEDIASTAYENPLMSEEAKLSAQQRRLRKEQSLFLQQRRQHATEQKKLEASIPQEEKQIQNLKADIAEKVNTSGDAFKMKIGGTEYTKRAEAGAAFEKLIKNFSKESSTKVGEIGGFDINMRAENTFASRGGAIEVISTRVFTQLQNHGVHSVEPSLRSIEHFISQGGIEKALTYAEKKLKDTQARLAAANENLAKPFQKQAELDEVTKRLEEVRAQISKQGTTAATEAEEPVDDNNPISEAAEQLKKNPRGEYSLTGTGDTRIQNFVADNALTPQQKLIQSFGEKLGVKTTFFRNDNSDFHGAHAGNASYINVNSKMPIGQVFWHESMHWLKNNNPKLYQQLVKAAGIIDEQRQAYLKDSKRKDLNTGAAIDNEIIADQFEDVAKRNGLLQSIVGKNRGLVERVIQWLKDTMNKFIEFFHNPQGKLTTKQKQALADEFGKIATRLVDPNGEKIFRYNHRTGNLETIGGRSMSKTTPLNEAGEIEYSVGNSNNSSESLTQKIRNAFSSWWKGGAKKNRNREITDLLYRVTGYKVDFGNVKDADKTIIDDVHKVIRAKHAYEWDKLLPQIGGKIAKSLKLNPTQEMSNYIADWCMTGAVGNQSAEAKAFEKAMHNDPVTAGLMLQIRESFQEFNDMTAEQKIGSTIVSRLQGKSPREIARTLWSDKEEEITDDLHPVLRQINDMIAKAEKTSPTLAKLMKDDINPYQMMRLLRGIGGLGDLMIGTEKVKDIEDVRDQFRAIYPRLKFDRLVTLDMIVDMAGGKKHVDGLMKYAVAKLDKEMHEKLREDPEADIRPQFSEAVDDEVIKNGEKQYAQAHRSLVTYSNILLCIQHDAGLIGDRAFTKAIKGWKNYIPMIRVFEDDKEFTIEDSLKHKTGSQRSTYNPMETLTQNTYDILSRAERNKAKQQLAFYARIGEFGDIIQEVETSNPGNNVITFREGGKIKYLKVFDPAVKRAVDNIYSPADTSWIMKSLRATMSLVRNMRTMGSPDFAIGNLFRDMQDAYIHNRHADANPLKALLDVFREGFKGFGFKRLFREKSLVPHDTDWAEFNALGGTQSTFVSEDVDQLRRSMNKLTRKTFMESFKEAPLHTVLDRLQWLSEQTEYMTRLNSYKRAKAELAKQRPDGKATLADKRLAALEARDASIDFAKAGTSTRKVNQLLMFANAQVQDWAKWGVIGRDLAKGGEARKIATQKIGRLVLNGVVTTLLFAALNRSDDDRKEKYKKRPDWEKETYWIFGDGVRIPKGQDIATRFVSALTDEFIDKALDDDPVSGKRLLKVIRDAVPSIIPSLIEPAYEVRMNYSAFRDAPIVPVGQQRLDKAEQYGRYTSSFAKLFSEMTGLTSPRGVDYLISNYLGSTGRFVTQLPDYMFGRGMTLNDVLMVRRFVFDPAENTKTVKEYYEAYDEQYKYYNTYKLRRKWDKNAKPHEDYDPKLFTRLKSAQDSLQNISKKENEILRNPKLDWDTKNKKIRELEKKREKICEKVMQRAR